MKKKCMICKEKIKDKLDDETIETPNYIFNLCLDCAIEIEDDIHSLIGNEILEKKEKINGLE
jgi:hypothetical protein